MMDRYKKMLTWGRGLSKIEKKKHRRTLWMAPKSLYENYLFKFPDAFSHATDGAETTER